MSVRHRKLNAPEYGTRPVSPPGPQGLPTPGSRRSGHRFATRYRFEALAELSAELNKSSGSLRAKQLDAVGHLLGTVSPQQRYAISFVRDRIPGAEAAGSNGHGSLSGQHLIGDLVHLMEDLSSQPVVDAASLSEKVWTREQLARRLNVSMKTISRWRRYGLVGRKVRLADGPVRTAFGESSIRRFVIQNHALVRRAAAFSRVTDTEKRAIEQKAAELLQGRPMTLQAVAQEITAETGRSLETVRHTLRQHDLRDPENSLFVNGSRPVISERDEAILGRRHAGESPEQIAEALAREPDEIRSVLRNHEVRLLVEAKPKYVYNEQFDSPEADDLILGAPVPPGASDGEKRKVPRSVPAEFPALHRVALLNREQEADLFRRFNYLKYKAARRIARLDSDTVGEQDLAQTRVLLTRATEIRSRLIGANLRLVVSIARRLAGNSPDFLEIVSDGNMSLMRAVTTFDYARGNRFSTYATWAITRNFSRTIPRARSNASRYAGTSDGLLATIAAPGAPPEHALQAKELRGRLADALARLDLRERMVIERRFGWAANGLGETLERIGKDFGVTKERVRQIQERALRQLREILLGTAETESQEAA